jgi:hypothetical protein
VVAGLAEFLGGLVLGVFLGVVLGPVIRLWLSWHQWVEASREARLTEDVLKRIDARPWRLPREKRPARARPPRSQPDPP